MKRIKVEDAVGSILCHDVTKIIPGEFKGTAFKKGHIIRPEDIPEFLSLGKDHIYVWENKEGMLHEDEAALRIVKLTAGEGLYFSEIKEGKIDFIAEKDGLLKVDTHELLKFNTLGDMVLVTVHSNTPVKRGQKVASARIIPLIIEEEKMKKAEAVINNKVVKVTPIYEKKVGIVTTGNEIFHGRIKDAFGPVLKEKFKEYGCEILGQVILPDNSELISEGIRKWIQKGAELIVCTGGMSVDPDDLTPSAIRDAGAEIVTYGAPVLPGSMFLLSYYDNVPVLGLPGCVMYNNKTVFDLILPRILSGERLKFEDVVMYGHGGLCRACEACTYPICSFGKGV